MMLRHFLFAFLFTSCMIPVVKAGSFQKHPEKIITINLIKKGMATIGKDTFTTDGLTTELKLRLWRSFTGTGKMQDELKLQSGKDVSSAGETAMINAIKKAQQDVLIELCLQLHKKRFDELNERQQDKIKKQYPVLFQQTF